jgi:hypothetical protein
MKRLVVFGIAVAALVFAGAALALDPAPKCQAGKNKDAGQYAACLQKAEMKLVKTKGTCSVTTRLECYRDGDCPVSETCDKDLTKYDEAVTKCNEKFFDKWAQLEEKAAGVCPDEPLDPNSLADFIAEHSDAVAVAIAGGGLVNDVGACNSDLETCHADLGTCNAGTAAASDVLSGETFSSSNGLGQTGTLTYCGDGVRNGAEQCDGADFDPDLTCGGGCLADCLCRFVDNGDGTVTDNQTRLVWEKKTNDSGVHDRLNAYTWSSSGTAPDGTAFTGFLATLDDPGGGTCSSGGPTGGCCSNSTCTDVDCFAGRCDWRLPTLAELQTILLDPYPCGTNPCIAPVFGPTAGGGHWSSTSYSILPDSAGGVSFSGGAVGWARKSTIPAYVRAVRGGL